MTSKFFVTERGEIAHQLNYAISGFIMAARTGDALLAITKCINNEKLQQFLVDMKKCTIVHATITGFGGSFVEPGVCSPPEAVEGIYNLIHMGFPASQIVLRVDPIIPTQRGIETAMKVIDMCPEPVRRIRFSFIDGYAGIKDTLPWKTFHAPKEFQDMAVREILKHAGDRVVEACGEPQLSMNQGCISNMDYDILGLPRPINVGFKGQRKGCMCIGTKTELLVKPDKCPNGCIYCYYNLGR